MGGMAIWGKKKTWFKHLELHGHFKPRPSFSFRR